MSAATMTLMNYYVGSATEDHNPICLELGEGLPSINCGWFAAFAYASLCYIFYAKMGTHVFAMITHGLFVPALCFTIHITNLVYWGPITYYGWYMSLGYFIFLTPMDIIRFRPIFLAHHLSSLYLFYDHVTGCRDYAVLVTGALLVDISSTWLGLRVHMKYLGIKHKVFSHVVDLCFALTFVLPRILFVIPFNYLPVVIYGREVYDCNNLPEWRINMVRLCCAVLIYCNGSWIWEIIYQAYRVYAKGKAETRTSADEIHRPSKAAVKKD